MCERESRFVGAQLQAVAVLKLPVSAQWDEIEARDCRHPTGGTVHKIGGRGSRRLGRAGTTLA